MTINIIKSTKKDSEKKANKKYENLSEEEKCKMLNKVQEIYQNLSEEQKQKLLEYMRNSPLTHKK